MDPYETLAVSKNSKNSEIKAAYKKMCLLTHPDKMNGSTLYFKMVKSAYEEIKKERCIVPKNCPTEKPEYTEYDIKYATKKFNIKKFNKDFDKNKGLLFRDPYRNGGYKVEKGNERKDVKNIYDDKIEEFDLPIVVYKEPKPMQSTMIENCTPLGVKRIKDYSCSIGTDYKRAHAKYKQRNISYKHRTLQSVMNEREDVECELSDEYKKSHKQKLELERIRIKRLKSQDASLERSFNMINNKLTYNKYVKE